MRDLFDHKKAQVSLEYTLVIGIIIIALSIVIAIAFFYSSSAKHQIIANQIDKVGKKIVETIDSIYYLGPPSKATIDLTMPNNIKEIKITKESPRGGTIDFIYAGSTGEAHAIYRFRALMSSDGQPLNVDTFKSAGIKKLVVFAYENSSIELVPTF